MADSGLTKRALSAAMKELMVEQPFSKISVGDICERCEMNRKSFYYHFKDKYDLVNWIFDTEFIAFARKKEYTNIRDFLVDLCTYFYENRAFYQRALQITGQDSFVDHFLELMEPLITSQLTGQMSADSDLDAFHIEFLTHALVGTIKRWIIDKSSIPPQKFVDMLERCVQRMAVKVYTEMEQAGINE